MHLYGHGILSALYKFEGIYPNSVSAIPLDYGATDQIEEFQVTFNYLFWKVIEGKNIQP